MDWTEKLPVDVLAIVFKHLLARKCGVCNRHYSMEVRNEDLESARQVNRHWLNAWSRLIIMCLRHTGGIVLCFKPEKCLKDLYASVEKIPFLQVLKTT